MRHRCVTEPDELKDLKDGWEALRLETGGSIFSSYELSTLWLKSFHSLYAPRVLTIEDKGGLVGLVPLALQRRSLFRIPINSLGLIGCTNDRMGLNSLTLLYDPQRQDVQGQVIAGIKMIEWDLLQLKLIPESPMANQLFREVRGSWDSQDLPPLPEFTAPFPEAGDITAFFGKRTRETLLEKQNKLEREKRLQFRSVRTEQEAERAIDTYVQQHIDRWASKGGSIFRQPDNVLFLKLATKAALSKGFGYMYEALIDGQVAGQDIGFYEKDLAWAYRVGMSNAFANYSPGMLVTCHAMQDLRERGIRAINMGGGKEGYKHHMGGKETRLLGIEAKRGKLSMLKRLADLPVVRQIDSRVGLRKRSLSKLYRLDEKEFQAPLTAGS